MEKKQAAATGPTESSKATEDRDEAPVRALIEQIKQGNQQAFTQLVHMYRNQVASIAYKLVNDYDEAADISQTVFVKVAKNIWRYDDRKKFYTWLYRITVNASIDHMRKNRRHHHEPLENFHETLESSLATPELTYQKQQLESHIEQAAQSLNDKQRSAFMLRDVEGCKIDDVANIMGMPEATVRWYLHRARTKVKKELRRRCPQLLVLMGIR
jgi:RNA polymerase sigma-70 factor (ECF subfamily)